MEKEQYIDVKNYIKQKKDLYYAVMVCRNVRGEKKEKWFPTKLHVKGNKKRAEAISRQILREFKIPREDLCMHEVKEDAVIDETKPIEPQLFSALLDKITLSELSTEQVGNLLFADYLKMYLPLTKKRKKREQIGTCLILHIFNTRERFYCPELTNAKGGLFQSVLFLYYCKNEVKGR